MNKEREKVKSLDKPYIHKLKLDWHYMPGNRRDHSYWSSYVKSTNDTPAIIKVSKHMYYWIITTSNGGIVSRGKSKTLDEAKRAIGMSEHTRIFEDKVK